MREFIYELDVVDSLAETQQGVALASIGGRKGVLLQSHPRYREMLGHLQFSRDNRTVVGICFGEQQQIIDVGTADRNRVRGFRESQFAPSGLNVWFDGVDGAELLRANHPRYQVLHDLIRQGKESQQWCWYVGAGNDILDVKMVSPDEDAALFQLIHAGKESGNA